MPKSMNWNRQNPGQSNAITPVYCSVLPWSFTINGGVNQVVNNLLAEFEKAGGVRPLALELCWEPPPRGDVLPTGTMRVYMRLRPPYISRRPVRSILSFLLHSPADLVALRRFAKTHHVVVFNMHFPDLAAFNFVMLRKLGLFRGKVLLSFQGSDIRGAYQTRGIEKVLWKLMLRGATAAVACSDGLKEEILMVEPRANTVTIYNAIDPDRFAARSVSEFQWPPALAGKRIILNVAGFEYRKGHDILLRAFRTVADRYDDPALLLIGKPGPVSAPVRRMISELKLESRVHIMEDVSHDRIYGIMAHSTLFVLATRWQKGIMGEGLAIALLEAAAARLPVVSTASCGTEELIADRQTGRVTPLDDPTALAEAICSMLDAPAEAAEMAARLHAHVRSHFTWKGSAEQFIALSLP
jgi:glycosyltransferase involved in cell wall biosynthesis